MATARKGRMNMRKDSIRSEGQASSIGSRCSVHKEIEEEDATVDKVHSSFRINQVAELFSTFTGEKEEMLRRIKFDGLMYLPTKKYDSKKKGNRQLAYWLLQRMDPESGTVDLGDMGKLELKPWDVNLVFGLPYEGEELRVSDPVLIDVTKKKVKKNMLLDETDELDLESVRQVLERDLVEKSSVYNKIAFITAAVIWATSYFLAPKGRPPRVNSEVLESLVCPREVYKINWASYVLKTLRDYSFKLKKDLHSQASSVCLDGCLLFLEIAYLDNLRFKDSTTTQYNTPRVRDFSYELLDRLIEMDKVPREIRQGSAFGNNEFRHPSESLYTRGMIYRDMLASVTEQCPTTSIEKDMEKLFAFIGHYNEEHNKSLRLKTTEFLRVLVEENNKHMKDVCKILKRWIQARKFQNVGSTEQSQTEYEDCQASLEGNALGGGEQNAGAQWNEKGGVGVNFNNFIHKDDEPNGTKAVKGKVVVAEAGVKRIMVSQGIKMAYADGSIVATSKRGRFKRPANRKPKDQTQYMGDQTDSDCEPSHGDAEQSANVHKM